MAKAGLIIFDEVQDDALYSSDIKIADKTWQQFENVTENIDWFAEGKNDE